MNDHEVFFCAVQMGIQEAEGTEFSKHTLSQSGICDHPSFLYDQMKEGT